MHDRDSRALRLEGGAKSARDASDLDLARVRLVDAGEDLAEGAFPRAVLSHEGMARALRDLEVHVMEGDDSRESFADRSEPYLAC